MPRNMNSVKSVLGLRSPMLRCACESYRGGDSLSHRKHRLSTREPARVSKMMSKIALISRVLDHFYPAPPIPLNHFDNFTLLVSVVLSAQTTDGKVNEVTKPLFEVAGTPQLMSAMTASEIQKIIQPVGLAPKKSVYLQKLSQKLIDDFDGQVPSTYENLESLPGVGHKTASVVMSQVCHKLSECIY